MRLRTSSIVVLGITATLALSGCSGLTELTGGILSGGGGPAFEFQGPVFDPEGRSMTVRVPQALLDARGEEADPVLVTSMKISSRDIEGADYCAFEVEPKFEPGALEILGARAEGMDEDDLSDAERAASQIVTMYDPSDLESFNESAPESGAYISEDASKILIVSYCSASLWEESDNVVWFPVQGKEGIDTLARADITVMKSGSLGIAAAEVGGFVVDSEGNWIGS